MKEIFQTHGTLVSVVMTLIVLAFAIGGYIYIYNQRESNKLMNHRGFIEMIPSLVSTIGVLGTFAGITIGLYYFDTNDLPTSIPLLLNGLKTAFFTSLAGMIGSLFLSGQVNRLFDEQTGGVSDSTQAANMIVASLNRIENNNSTFHSAMLNQIADHQAKTQEIHLELQRISSLCNGVFQNTTRESNLINDVLLRLESIDVKAENMQPTLGGIRNSAEHTNELLNDYGHWLNAIGNRTESLLQSVGNIEETNNSVLAKAEERNNRLGEMLDHTEALVSGQETTNEHVSKFGDRLHGEVVEIEDKMTETNKLLTEKFEEFSELLRRSNTEALVEVMKKVTEEFQKQMNALINKLIQENFDQLNKSVEQLVTWQKENKEMIQSLTSQYKQMAENFENTSTSLTKVDEDTRQLVSEGGKLRQIVDSLNKVIVEDEKFIKISTDLQNTADLTKTNYEQFDAATKSLNDWVKKQRNFVDGVTVLIQKLEELNKIRDYGEQFWEETRKQMNEGVGIISGGTRTLNEQVTGLNEEFYARLSATLTTLDNCIQALISNAEENR